MGNPSPHRARKRFGQHFLHDHNIIDKMLVAIRPRPEDSLIEIGPGQGALTFPLLERCQSLTAVELDRDLIAPLQRRAESIGTLTLLNQDVLTVDLATIGLTPPLRIVGNLPYNISTPLMFHLMRFSEMIEDLHFMVQKEVALRLIATPGDKQQVKHYGRLSVMMQFYCSSEMLFEVPPGCFSPPPKVDSAVIRLRPHRQPPARVTNIQALEDIVKAAFGQRRKTISNALKQHIPSTALAALGVDPAARAERLALADFANIANAVNELK